MSATAESRLPAPRWSPPPVLRRLAPYLLLVLLNLAVWGRTVRYEFVWDDLYSIVKLESIRSLDHLGRMFTDRTAQVEMAHQPDALPFRPLRNIVFALLVAAGGAGKPVPWLFHLANVVGHTGATLLLFAAVERLRRQPPAGVDAAPPEPSQGTPDARPFALFVAAAWSVHPVVTEVVCWAKALDDVLSAVFTFGALLCLAGGRSTRRYAGALALFVFAVYSKASAVPLALAAGAFWLLLDRRKFRDTVLRALPFLAVAVFYVFHRRLVLGRTSQIAPLSGSYGQTLLDMTEAVVRYARLLFGIPPFQIDYSYMKGGHTCADAFVWGGFALLAALLLLVLLGLRRPRLRLPAFGAAWLGLFLLPVSNLVPMMQYMAERFLYLPLAGFVLALAAALAAVLRPRLFAPVACAIVVAWAAETWQRSAIWKDEFALYGNSVGRVAGWRVEAGIVRVALDAPHVRRFITGQVPPEEVAAAWPAVQRSLDQLAEWYPDNVFVLNANGVARMVLRRPDEALPWFDRARKTDPDVPESYTNLALALSQLGHRAEARAVLAELLARDPDNAEARRMLGDAPSDAPPDEPAARPAPAREPSPETAP